VRDANGLEWLSAKTSKLTFENWPGLRPALNEIETEGLALQTRLVDGKDYLPNISADGLALYFASDRPAGYGNMDLWVTRRATAKDEWGEPVNLGSTVNTSVLDFGPSISVDGLELCFSRGQDWGTDIDIWLATRAKAPRTPLSGFEVPK
jgi:hypothetical protein